MLTRPMGPWWLSADCDTAYVGSALNLLGGHPTEKLDHPGMPLQAVLTVSFALDHAARSLIIQPRPLSNYIDGQFLDMSQSLRLVRGWAIAFFLFGLASAYLVGRRILGSAGWGLAAAALVLAAPGTLAHATTFRPENLLAGLVLWVLDRLVVFGRYGRTKDLATASLLTGLAIAVKIHAVALLPALGLAILLAPRTRDGAGGNVPLDRAPAVGKKMARAAMAAALMAVAVLFNAERPWWRQDGRLVAGCIVLAGANVWLWRRWRTGRRRGGVSGGAGMGRAAMEAGGENPEKSRFAEWFSQGTVAGGCLLMGLALSCLPFLEQFSPMCRALYWTLAAARSDPGPAGAEIVEVLARFLQPSLLPVLPIALLGVVAAAASVVWGKREEWPIVAAFLGFTGLAVAQGASHGSPHHFGIGLAAAIIPTLRLFQMGAAVMARFVAASSLDRGLARGSTPGPAAAMASLALATGLVAWPIWKAEAGARGQAIRCTTIQRATDALSPCLAADEYLMTSYWAQNADAAFFMQARDTCAFTPERTYASLPDSPTAWRYAVERGLHPRFYLLFRGPGSLTSVERSGDDWATLKSPWGPVWRVRRIGQWPMGDAAAIEAYEWLEPPEISALASGEH